MPPTWLLAPGNPKVRARRVLYGEALAGILFGDRAQNEEVQQCSASDIWGECAT